jgi:hypothetical protein
MSSEQRLDRLEKIVRLVVKEGLRERREMRDRINALISAQMRDEEALTQHKVRTEEAFTRLASAQATTDESLNAFITNTDKKLNAFIGAVERLVNERGGEKP